MGVWITTHREQTLGPDLKINCPKCGALDTSAASYELRDQLKLLFVIPLFKLTNTYVSCAACGTALTSRLSIDELRTHSPSDISHFLSYEISLVVKFLAILSLLLLIAPLVGFVLAILTVVLSRKSGGWPRTIGIVALLLSGIVTIPLVVLLAIAG